MTAVNTVDLDELVLSTTGDLQLLELLHSAVNDGTMVIGLPFTDEEMASFGVEIDAEHLPWLGGLPSEHAEIAVREAARNLAANGIASILDEADGEQVSLAPAVTTFLWARTNFDLIVVAEAHAENERLWRCILYRLSPHLFMMEVIGPLGYHEVSYCTPAVAVEWVATQASADPSTDVDVLEEAIDAEQMIEFMQRLESSAHQQTFIYAREWLDDETQIFREVSIIDHAEGTWLGEYFDDRDEKGWLRVRRTGHTPLVGYLLNFVRSAHEEGDPADGGSLRGKVRS